ncbi:hypothetical protein [Brevibacterium sp.]|nr:hypothetical protein [Brevibacterium sp.]
MATDRTHSSALITTIVAASIPLLALGVFLLLKFGLTPLAG